MYHPAALAVSRMVIFGGELEMPLYIESKEVTLAPTCNVTSPHLVSSPTSVTMQVTGTEHSSALNVQTGPWAPQLNDALPYKSAPKASGSVAKDT